jgi:GDP-4-dehydro-6-deoxy-D-mannose reductase
VTVCLITGIGGFLGSHLTDFLLTQGWEVAGVLRKDRRNVAHIRNGLVLFQGDILDKAQLEGVVRETRPNAIFHLAAQSLPSRSWQEPGDTFRANVLGTLNLLEAMRAAKLDPFLVVAGSSAEYGSSGPSEVPIKEDAPLRPSSPYGVSKVATTQLALLYGRAFQMRVVVARPFFVIGPRKSGDVCSDFARGVVAVEKGKQPSLNVGNLETVRDFLDVEDAVRALWLLVQKGVPGEVYNICSGAGHKIQTVLEALVDMGIRPIPIKSDPCRLRPVDQPVVVGDNSCLRALGWAPQVPLDQSLARILDYWRNLS